MHKEKSIKKHEKLMTKEVFICTSENPWSPKKKIPVIHPEAYELGEQQVGWPAGDVITYQCPNCGHKWNVELPQ